MTVVPRSGQPGCTVRRLQLADGDPQLSQQILHEEARHADEIGCQYFAGCSLLRQGDMVQVAYCDEAPMGGHKDAIPVCTPSVELASA